MNSIMTLVVYRHGGMWVFDDSARGLVKEPFVAGMPAIIDRLVAGLRYAALGFQLTFSARPFPEPTTTMRRQQMENGGHWYEVTDGPAAGMVGWLCPALYKFFDAAPELLYFNVKEVHRG
jgi:hypothetical protein